MVVEAVIKGDTVREVLQYVEFDTNTLMHQMRSDVDQAVREKRLDDFQAGRLLRFYEDGLDGYTYLEDAAEERPRRLLVPAPAAPQRAVAGISTPAWMGLWARDTPSSHAEGDRSMFSVNDSLGQRNAVWPKNGPVPVNGYRRSARQTSSRYPINSPSKRAAVNCSA